MRRLAATGVLVTTGLLLTSGAAGLPSTPGDPTPPIITPIVTRGTQGTNDWYTTDVRIRWDVQDPESPDFTTTGCDTEDVTVEPGQWIGCTAESDGGRRTEERLIKLDKTAPALVPDPEPDPNAHGWHRAPLRVEFNGTDARSGIASCTPDLPYGGPDNANFPITGSCTDTAGNRTDATYTVRYDTTKPTAAPAPSPQPNQHGWHKAPLSVGFVGSDTMSGPDQASCTAAQPYSGPDTASREFTGTCKDLAGNTSNPSSYTVKYDTTKPTAAPAPSPQPNQHGWHKAPLSVGFVGSDTMSGPDQASCTAAQPYSGPDTASREFTGTCKDLAGNTSNPSSYTVKYDTTKPTAAPAPSPQPNQHGWHKAPLSVGFVGSDTMSGPDQASCTAAQPYSGPDTASREFTGTCKDLAGNTSNPSSYTVKYDTTKPTAAPAPSPQPNQHGWHKAPLSVGFVGSDTMSGPDQASCTAAQPYSGPDTASREFTGTCKDLAGNTSNPSSYTVKYDSTPPTNVSGSTARLPDSNGWYNHDLTVGFAGSDPTSGIPPGGCTQTTYGFPDSGDAAVTGTCSDRASNQSAASTLRFKYDETAPSNVSGSAARLPDSNGWYNHELAVSFAGSDPTSGIPPGGCTQTTYGFPDSGDAAVTGTCSDRASNQSAASTLRFKYDETAPSNVSGSAARLPDSNGWYNHELAVSFAGSDPTSGIPPGGCTQTTYGFPDSGDAAVTGTCSDRASNQSAASTLRFKYDETAPSGIRGNPSRSPDANDWYNHELTVTFAGSDLTSGVPPGGCTQTTYGSPEGGDAAVTGTCSDRANNQSGLGTFRFKYDETAPEVIGITPAPDPSGWYTQPVVFGFLGRDELSGLDSCPAVTYDGPDGAKASVTGTCLDKAGNSGTGSFGLKYDDTGPQVTVSAERVPDNSGWYNHRLAVSFSGSDAASGVASCVPEQDYAGPDTVFAVVTGTCRDNAGNVGLGSLALKYDSTAPQVDGASPDRAPDGNGWYNRPLDISFHGSDATSDIETCTVAAYAGPDNPSASLAGTCRDRAGNPSGANAFPFKYDASAPTVRSLTVKAANRSASLTWDASPDTSIVELSRSAGAKKAGVMIYRGSGRSFTDTGLENGVRYRYRLTGYDEASNAATKEVVAAPTAPLYSPQAGSTVSAPPRLAWKAVTNATYYNVQVWRRGKILSVWPSGTSVQLKRTWIYRGRRYRLTPGRYAWYVWPGYGSRSKERFGRLIGSSSFRVR